MDDEDDTRKAERLAARAARFSKNAPGKRIKELEQARANERQAFEQQGLITLGKTELDAAVDMRGTCERMCSAFEAENRNIRGEVHPFERGPDMKMDVEKAVAAYTRSDAGAGHGESAILPSDLRTPTTLSRTLDYLFSQIMSTPPANSGSRSLARKALGYSAGFIRDRTRAIRKEFAMQSSWGHGEAIASFERIARWHILCLRELQEETGTNTDMHIDSAELGRCFTSLRQQYNDRREETGQEMPCPNEPEFRAYMLIFDLANKSVSIPTAELPSVILDHPLVQLAWEIRKTAQRNFDTQKEGSKVNSELGANLITRFIKLLKDSKMPFLLSCLVEIRLRDIRRSALRAMTRTYPRLRADPVRMNEMGQVVERRMVLLSTLDEILGCEEQDDEDPAFDDVEQSSKRPDDEAVNIVSRFELEVYPDHIEPVGSLIHVGAPYNDNRDAPYTRRWNLITNKRRGLSLVDIVNGQSGVHVHASLPLSVPSSASQPQPSRMATFDFGQQQRKTIPTTTPAISTAPTVQPTVKASKSAFSFSFGAPAPASPQASAPVPSAAKSAFSSEPEPPADTFSQPSPTSAPPKPASTMFSFGLTTLAPTPSQPQTSTISVPSPMPPLFTQPSFFSAPASTISPVQPNVPAVTVVQTPPKAVSLPSRAIPTQAAPKQQPRSTHSADRKRKERAALPSVRDLILEEVIQGMLSDMRPELEKTVKQHEAAVQYTKAKATRQALIVEWSQQTYQNVLKQVVREAAQEAVLCEFGRRYRLRKTIRIWKRWAQSQREQREAAKQERERMLNQLSHLGLGHSTVTWDEEDLHLSGSSDASESTIVPMDEFEVDVSLQQAERSKDHFFSPATFLDSTARHVAPLLHASTNSIASSAIDYAVRSTAFRTIISPARDSATPCSEDAEKWLLSKFMPQKGENYNHDEIDFETDVVGRYDDLPGNGHAGLLVMELPTSTWDSGKQRQNVLDVQDRLSQLSQIAARDGNRFMPPLMIVAWQEESFEEVIDRLQIVDNFDSFYGVALLTLESSEDLDARYAEALADLMPEIVQKDQVTIRLLDVVNRLNPSISGLFDVASHMISQWASSTHVASASFSAGIEAISQLPRVIQQVIGSTVISDSSTFEVLDLPPFERFEGNDMSSLVDAIIAYLSSDVFTGVSDLSLLSAPLRQAAQLSHFLRAIALLVWGEIANQGLLLEIYLEDTHEYVAGLLDKVSKGYLETIEEKISTIAKSGAQAQIQDQAQSHNPSMTVIGTKRSRPSGGDAGYDRITDENTPVIIKDNGNSRLTPRSGGKMNREKGKKIIKESKAAKNARLLRVMRDVSRTLEKGLESSEVVM